MGRSIIMDGDPPYLSDHTQRRIDCAYLAELVSRHQLNEEAAAKVARDLAYRLVKQAYKL